MRPRESRCSLPSTWLCTYPALPTADGSCGRWTGTIERVDSFAAWMAGWWNACGSCDAAADAPVTGPA